MKKTSIAQKLVLKKLIIGNLDKPLQAAVVGGQDTTPLGTCPDASRMLTQCGVSKQATACLDNSCRSMCDRCLAPATFTCNTPSAWNCL